jgi:hypothetical protein
MLVKGRNTVHPGRRKNIYNDLAIMPPSEGRPSPPEPHLGFKEFVEMMHEAYAHELRGHFRVSMGNKINEPRVAIGRDMLAATTSEASVKQIS